MRVVQINLHHSKAASAAFSKKFLEGGFEIGLIQEPWTYKGKICGLGGLEANIFANINAKEAPRACIIYKKQLNVLPINQFCKRDLVAVKLTNQERVDWLKDTILCSAYVPFDSQETPPR